MPYRSTDRTRKKKDAKRTAMMQAAVRVFAEKGYYAATIRDIVAAADVAVGTFYFYFPDKETLFAYLYEETAEFLLRTVRQALNNKTTLPQQIGAALKAYINIAVFEPAVIHLLLVGGVGAAPSLIQKRADFREAMINLWQKPLDDALDLGQIAPQNTRRSAEALVGAFDEVILNLLDQPEPEAESSAVMNDMAIFALRAVKFGGN